MRVRQHEAMNTELGTSLGSRPAGTCASPPHKLGGAGSQFHGHLRRPESRAGLD